LPFLADQFVQSYLYVSVGFAIALGMRQTVGESIRGTWLLLLHHPIERRRLIIIKLIVGSIIYLIVSAAAILIYASWAATPGTHPGPFYWWMTTRNWALCFIILLGYYGAFFSGIRQGNWFGTRLMPLAASGLFACAIGVAVIDNGWWLWGFLGFVPICAIFVGSILFVAQTRDYS
jgi:hypothetical protein